LALIFSFVRSIALSGQMPTQRRQLVPRHFWLSYFASLLPLISTISRAFSGHSSAHCLQIDTFVYRDFEEYAYFFEDGKPTGSCLFYVFADSFFNNGMFGGFREWGQAIESSSIWLYISKGMPWVQ
jgi:hypothetical protein